MNATLVANDVGAESYGVLDHEAVAFCQKLMESK